MKFSRNQITNTSKLAAAWQDGQVKYNEHVPENLAKLISSF
jgi:hypothetical protein